VRIVLSLFLLVAALTLITTNGCSNTNFTTEEGKTMAENVSPASGSNMVEGYKTATFALG
jgi:hypothetical protein